MKKIIAILMILIMIGSVVYAEDTEVKTEKKESVKLELPKYTTADKAAITVVTATLFTIVTIVAKEVVVDGAYGARE